MQIFRRQDRQRLLPFASERPGAFAQIIEEGRQIAISGVDLVPDPFNAARIEPTGDQGGLAGTGRAYDADCGLVGTCLIKHCKQPFSRHRLVQSRSRELGQLRTIHRRNPIPEAVARHAPRRRAPAALTSPRATALCRRGRVS